MVEIKKMKIRKQIYQFEVRRKFQYFRTYKIKEKRPIDKILESLSSAFAKRKKMPLTGAPPASRAGGLNKAILFVSILAALLVLIGGGLYIYLQNIKAPDTYATRAIATPEINIELLKSGVVTASPPEAPMDAAYVRLAYSTNAIQMFNISLWTYGSSVPSEVFILKSRMDKSQTSSYPAFKSVLKEALWDKKISVNEMDIEQVETLPKGAILVVPSAFVPQELLGVGSNFSIKKLIDRGVVILYIGYPFDNMIASQGSIVSVSPEIKADLPFAFEKDPRVVPLGISLEPPYYSVKGVGQVYSSFYIYGAVSVVKKADGALLVVPQSLDAGWKKDGAAAARDIARVIKETAWVMPDYPHPTVYSYNYSVENTTISEFFTFPFQGDNRYVKLDISGIDLNGEPVGEMRVIKVEKEAKGSLYIQGGTSVVSSAITGNDVKMIASLKEPGIGQKMLYMSFIKDGQQAGDKILIDTNPVSLQVERHVFVPINLESGAYILNVVDEEGKIYAQALMKVVFVDIKRLPDIEERRIFHFLFEKEGQPVLLNDVEVTIKSKNGADFGTYSFSRTSDPKIDVSKNVMGDNKLPYNQYSFIFKIGSIKKTVPVDLSAPENVFLSPPFIATIVFSGAILLMGVYLARKETVSYQLDIPDFPPMSKTKIPIKTETIVGIFDKVNDDYRWKYAPLTVQEIKNGFKNVFFEGKPIFISDYNVEFVMDKLIRKKLVMRFLDYYALLKWEQESKHSIRYLSIFRKLRDIFVNNAVPFSLMGEEEDCDTKINLMGQEMFVHIYDKRGDMKRLVSNLLKTSKKGISIVVFKDSDEKSDFRDILSSASPVSAALKLEVETNAVQLMDVAAFESMVQEMKSV